MTTYAAAHRYPAGRRPRQTIGSADRWRRVGSVAPSTQELLDGITSLAREQLDVAAVCLSVVDTERRLLTSSYGLPLPTALLLSHAFRRHIMASNRPLVVTDGRCDPLVTQIPALRDGMVRACVGIPLRTADDRAVGILLAMDQRARLWTAPQIALLGRLSSLIENKTALGAPTGRPPEAASTPSSLTDGVKTTPTGLPERPKAMSSLPTSP